MSNAFLDNKKTKRFGTRCHENHCNNEADTFYKGRNYPEDESPTALEASIEEVATEHPSILVLARSQPATRKPTKKQKKADGTSKGFRCFYSVQRGKPIVQVKDSANRAVVQVQGLQFRSEAALRKAGLILLHAAEHSPLSEMAALKAELNALKKTEQFLQIAHF